MKEIEIKINGTQAEILELLTVRPRTRLELAIKLNLSQNTIRGRVSELNSMGFEIKFDKPTQEYKLAMTSKPYTKLVMVDSRPGRRKNNF